MLARIYLSILVSIEARSKDHINMFQTAVDEVDSQILS